MNDGGAFQSQAAVAVVGRYLLHAPIARGGMATIYLARLTGAEGFNRIVAAKRLHAEYTVDSDFVSMFLDEARIASKVHHPNVVPVLDLVTTGSEVIIVQEYVHGVPLNVLFKIARKGAPIPIRVAVAIAAGVLRGLNAAHEARDELGQPLCIVHRDVSPQNVIVSVEGAARLLDFGVAKAAFSAHITREGTFKGKVAYMSPEQVRGTATRASDVYSLGVLFWEALVNRRMHEGRDELALLSTTLTTTPETITAALAQNEGLIPKDRWDALVALEPIVVRALATQAADRYATAQEMADALVAAVAPAAPREVAEWVRLVGKGFLEGREKLMATEEVSWRNIQINGPASDAEPSIRTLASAEKVSVFVDGPGSVSRSRLASIPISFPPPSRKKVAWLVALGVFLVGVVGFSAWAVVPHERQESLQQVEGTATAIAPMLTVPSAASSATAQSAATAPATQTAASDPPRVAPGRAFPMHPRPTPRDRASTQSAASSASQPAVTATPSSTAADTDCNPPFYFEGKKKVFKTNCL